jgi:hypothetical protein
MTNVFNSNVHKQFYIEGVQDENRDSLPMRYVSDIQTDNAEYLYNRFGADMTAQNSTDSTYSTPGFTYSADSKLIDREAISADRITNKEMSREGFDIVADRTNKHAYAIKQAVHRHATRTTRLGAGGIVDNEVLAGSTSAGTPITVSTSNPDDIAATVVQVLQEGNAYGERNPYIMMSPKQAKFFNLFSMGAGFTFADRALESGMFMLGGGERIIRGAAGFGGLDVIVTNETPRTSLYTLAANLTADDTVTVNGVVFTVVASPSTAGDVDLGADAEGTIDNLVVAINGGAGAGSAYIEVSAANRTILTDAGITALKTTAAIMEVEAFVTLTVAEAGAQSSWGTVVDHMIAGAYNSTTIALPAAGANVEEKQVPLFNGIELMYAQQHDAVIWTKDAPKLVDVLTVA